MNFITITMNFINHNKTMKTAKTAETTANSENNNKMTETRSVACLAALSAAIWLASTGTGFAGERSLWSDGHGDLSVHYTENQWQWGVEVDSLPGMHPPEKVIIALGADAQNAVPDDPAFAFLGGAGDLVWILPQFSQKGVPFMGVHVDTASPQAVFEGNRFNWQLSSVAGPGDFAMWRTGSAGQVNVLMNSRDGIDETDRTDEPAPGHFHQNWGFTSPGTHFVGFRAQGILAGASAPVASDEQLYRFAVNVFDRGEVDLEVVFEDGKWELVLLDEANEREFAANEAALHVGPATWRKVPDDPAFAFLGNPGDTVYLLPQDEQEGVLFLGIAADEIESGIFEDDAIGLNLASVEGPGAVSLYATDALGKPTVFFNSADGISASDHFPLPVGGHSHPAWGFASPGIYRIGLTASGTLGMSGQTVSSGEAVFLFEVFGPTVFGEGELDIEVVFEDDEWELAALDEAGGREICATELILQCGPETRIEVPNDPAFRFLGKPGAVVNVLPQDEQKGVLFLGIAADEIESGIFEDDAIGLNLASVEGPGAVSLYATDALGKPTVFFNSADGISASDHFPLPVGGHSHPAWGFTVPGVYRVGLQAAGTLVAGSKASASEVAVFTFEVLTGSVSRPRIYGRLLIGDGTGSGLSVINLESGEVRPNAFDLGARAGRIYASGSGRYAIAVSSDANTAHLFDGGIYLEEHGDHFDLVEGELQRLDVDLSGDRPVHLYVSGERSAIFYDGSGDVALIDEHELERDGNSYTPTIINVGAHHGAAVLLEGGLIATTIQHPDFPGDPDARLPIGAEIRDAVGRVLYRAEGCDGLHGDAGNGHIAVFGCVGGALAVEAHDGEFEHRFIPAPADSPDDFRLTSVWGYHDLDHFFALGSAVGLYLVEPEDGTMERLIPAADDLRPIQVAFSHDGEQLLVVMSDGELRVYDAHDADLLVSARGFLSDDIDSGFWARPHLATAADQIFITDSVAGEVIALDAQSLEVIERWRVPGEPTKIAFVGVLGESGSGGHDGHGHGDELELHIEFSADGSLALRWLSESGKQYQVQAKSGSLDADWADRFEQLMGTGEVLEQPLAVESGGAEFFRVIELP